MQHVQNYVACLRDPFCCPPVPLPIPSPEGSFVARAILRLPLTINADGTFAAYLTPALSVAGTTGSIYTNVSGAAGTTWVGTPFVNQALIMAAAKQGRVISAGIRVVTQVPATSAPGFLYSGSFAITPDSLLTLSPTTLTGYPLMKQTLGNVGCFSISRPIDMEAYDYRHTTITATSTLSLDNTHCVIVGTGLPASSTVSIEAVLNLECLPNLSGAAQIDAAPNNFGPSSVPTVEPSLLLQFARNALGVASGALDAAGSTATAIAAGAAHMVVGASNALIPGRTMYNQPRMAATGALQPYR
jgi:hypothetical protein